MDFQPESKALRNCPYRAVAIRPANFPSDTRTEGQTDVYLFNKQKHGETETYSATAFHAPIEPHIRDTQECTSHGVPITS